ncbi:hypothetical protein [Streptomyces boncukensis]|uniref:Uncharacterized protein n=1 Tax=Streptomyces boncukensis TaxID=2711219 RepID=A0A6G4WPJ1_9ACTN|nr:hypothetical protein [Streptomyces boncukensis]NGO67008.1 hypothetical protein [Streptomyces boncukensis]
MITLNFALNEVIDIAMHTMLSPRETLRPTYEQCESEEPVRPSLWWVREGSRIYLTGNSTRKNAPRDAFAEGYGPGGDDTSGIPGLDDGVIEVFPLDGPLTGACLYSALLCAQVDGHNTLTITLGDDVDEMRARHRSVPVAPYGLTTYTHGIVDLARAKGLRLAWSTGTARHLLNLTSPGPHGVSGHIVIGARSGKVLRAALTYPSDGATTQTTASGTNAVRELFAGLSPSPCPPGCDAPAVDACHARAAQ